MTLSNEAKKEAADLNIKIGRMSSKKDCAGFYDVFETVDGVKYQVGESMMCDTADEAKAYCINDLINQRSGDPELNIFGGG